MPKITFITHDKKSHLVEVQNGLTLMQAADDNNITGIVAECGGGMACSTCHVYVEDKWLEKLNKKTDEEEGVLDMAFEPKKNSRLSCQIEVSDEIDGLVVHIPEKQVAI
jgi:2Fe-2S ferredoxin